MSSDSLEFPSFDNSSSSNSVSDQFPVVPSSSSVSSSSFHFSLPPLPNSIPEDAAISIWNWKSGPPSPTGFPHHHHVSADSDLFIAARPTTGDSSIAATSLSSSSPESSLDYGSAYFSSASSQMPEFAAASGGGKDFSPNSNQTKNSQQSQQRHTHMQQRQDEEQPQSHSHSQPQTQSQTSSRRSKRSNSFSQSESPSDSNSRVVCHSSPNSATHTPAESPSLNGNSRTADSRGSMVRSMISPTSRSATPRRSPLSSRSLANSSPFSSSSNSSSIPSASHLLVGESYLSQLEREIISDLATRGDRAMIEFKMALARDVRAKLDECREEIEWIAAQEAAKKRSREWERINFRAPSPFPEESFGLGGQASEVNASNKSRRVSGDSVQSSGDERNSPRFRSLLDSTNALAEFRVSTPQPNNRRAPMDERTAAESELAAHNSAVRSFSASASDSKYSARPLAQPRRSVNSAAIHVNDSSISFDQRWFCPFACGHYFRKTASRSIADHVKNCGKLNGEILESAIREREK